MVFARTRERARSMCIMERGSIENRRKGLIKKSFAAFSLFSRGKTLKEFVIRAGAHC